MRNRNAQQRRVYTSERILSTVSFASLKHESDAFEVTPVVTQRVTRRVGAPAPRVLQILYSRLPTVTDTSMAGGVA